MHVAAWLLPLGLLLSVRAQAADDEGEASTTVAVPGRATSTPTSTSAAGSAATSDAAAACSWSNKCPADKPCCGPWGRCGTGLACVAGRCDPNASFDLAACAPAPLCQSRNVRLPYR